MELSPKFWCLDLVLTAAELKFAIDCFHVCFFSRNYFKTFFYCFISLNKSVYAGLSYHSEKVSSVINF